MNKSIICAAIAFMCQFSAAQERPALVQVGDATYRFTDRRFAKDFERTLIFGHSISGTLVNKIGGFGVSGPGTVLAQKYAEVEPLANISEDYGDMETGLSKMHRWNKGLQHVDGTSGSDRDIDSMTRRLNQASLVIGVDALYMSVVFDQCAPIGDYVDVIIEDFVKKMAAQNKVLILGNVPKEDWSQTSLLARWILRNNNEDCREKINTALKSSCTPDRNCYLVDLENIVATMHAQGGLRLHDGTFLKQEARATGLMPPKREVRWDGINLTNRGVQYIVEDILRMMKENPPRDLRGVAPQAPR